MSANLDQVVSNPSYIVNSKVTSITKTVTGKIIFWSGNTPIVGISEEKDIYLDFGQGTAFLIVERLFVYNFNFLYLTNIDGRPYTPPAEGDLPAYQTFLKEVYEDLQSLFVGCCECGGGSSSVEFVDTFEALPATGTVNVLYVVKTPPSLYLWNGTDYDSVGGGGGDFIPRSGTVAGSPVTGPIQMSALTRLYDLFGDSVREVIWDDEGGLKIRVTDTVGGNDIFVAVFGEQVQIQATNGSTGFFYNVLVSASGGVLVGSSDPNFKGIEYNSNYSSNFILRSLIDLEVLKSRLFNKAGVPTITDDTNQGYVANQSLLLDTTTGIIYRCTSATAGAATWDVYYDPAIHTKSRMSVIEQDFLHVSTSAYNQIQATAVSSGTQVVVTGNANHPGIVALRDSTTANGGYLISTNLNALLLAGGEKATFVFQDRNTTTRATAWIRLGFFDSGTSALPTDAAFIQIQGGVLQGICRNNNTPTATGTTFTVTQNTWYSATIEVISTLLVRFTVFSESGTQLWTSDVTTNIPTAAGRETGFGAMVYETTTDAPADILHLDYLKFEINRTLVR